MSVERSSRGASIVWDLSQRRETNELLARLRSHDREKWEHSKRVAVLCVGVGEQLGLRQQELRVLGAAGLMHEIGALMFPVDLLNRPPILEWGDIDISKVHPKLGYEMVVGVIPEDARVGVRDHCNFKLDDNFALRAVNGFGTTAAQVVAVCDVNDNLRHPRGAKFGMKPRAALELTAVGFRGDARYFQALARVIGRR